MRNPQSRKQTIIGERELTNDELRRLMYERIASGHALASADEVARQDNRHSRKSRRK